MTTQSLAHRLMDIRPDFYAHIARHIGVERQHVRRVCLDYDAGLRLKNGKPRCEPIVRALLQAVKHRRYP